MKINTRAKYLDLTPPINQYLEQKIGSLARFIKSFDKDGVAEIWLEISRTTKHHRRGKVFRAEADLRLPGKILRVESENCDIRVAIDQIKDKLQREIKKYKELIRKIPKARE